MSNIIENKEIGTPLTSGRATGHDIDTVKSVYQDITSKNQELSKIFKEPHVVKFDDLKQLMRQILQSISQQNCITQNCSFTILYLDDVQAQITSFEEFASYDTSQNSPVESISIEINFLTQAQGDERPSSNKIEVVLISLVALKKKISESHDIELSRLARKSDITGLVLVEHSNYITGQFILSTISNWYDGLEKLTLNPMLKFLRKLSEWIPTSARLLFLATFATVILIFFEGLFGPSVEAFKILQNGFIVFVAITIFSDVAFRVGIRIQTMVENASTASVIKLNEADDKAHKAYVNSNGRRIGKVVLATIGNFIISIVASLAVVLLT